MYWEYKKKDNSSWSLGWSFYSKMNENRMARHIVFAVGLSIMTFLIWIPIKDY